jgi:hypothetical protein
LVPEEKRLKISMKKIICSVKLAWTVQISRKKNNKKILQRIGLQLNLATLMLYFISWASEAAESGGGVDPHSPPLLEPSK